VCDARMYNRIFNARLKKRLIVHIENFEERKRLTKWRAFFYSIS